MTRACELEIILDKVFLRGDSSYFISLIQYRILHIEYHVTLVYPHDVTP